MWRPAPSVGSDTPSGRSTNRAASLGVSRFGYQATDESTNTNPSTGGVGPAVRSRRRAPHRASRRTRHDDGSRPSLRCCRDTKLVRRHVTTCLVEPMSMSASAGVRSDHAGRNPLESSDERVVGHIFCQQFLRAGDATASPRGTHEDVVACAGGRRTCECRARVAQPRFGRAQTQISGPDDTIRGTAIEGRRPNGSVEPRQGGGDRPANTRVRGSWQYSGLQPGRLGVRRAGATKRKAGGRGRIGPRRFTAQES